jgi:octanoyl-[GcvH]:protein N-octanoyltransferase
VTAEARRLYRPEPTVAFGRLDRLRPGYDDAVAAARAHGFAPELREPGGHAVAYHGGSLVIESSGTGGIGGVRERFEREAERIAAALRSLGVDARVGPVPGEYCAGAYSVNLGGRVKLAGLAQRVRRGRWTLGASIVCEDPEPVRAVLTDVYAALALDFDPMTVGVPGPSIDSVSAALHG